MKNTSKKSFIFISRWCSGALALFPLVVLANAGLLAIPAKLDFGQGRPLLKSVMQPISIANITKAEMQKCEYWIEKNSTFKYIDSMTCQTIKPDASCRFMIQALPTDNKTEVTYLHTKCQSPNKNYPFKLKTRLSISGVGYFGKNKESVIELMGDNQVPYAKAHKLALSPDGKNVYVASNKENFLRTLRIVAAKLPNEELAFKKGKGWRAKQRKQQAQKAQQEPKGEMEILADKALPAEHAVDLAMSNDGKFLYVATSSPDMITIYNRDNSAFGKGALRAEVGDGAGKRIEVKGVSSLALSPDGKFLYAMSAKEERLRLFHRDLQTGMLTGEESLVLPAISYEFPFVLTPNGKMGIFATANSKKNEKSEGEILLLVRDLATGKFAMKGAIYDAKAPIGKIVVSADSRFLYNLSTNPTPNIFRLKIMAGNHGNNSNNGIDDEEFVDLKKTNEIENIVSGEIGRDGRLFLLGNDNLRIFKITVSGHLKLLEAVDTPVSQNTDFKFNPRGKTFYGLATAPNASDSSLWLIKD
jgi:DNA-binding beta-propeller fold protein YncE